MTLLVMWGFAPYIIFKKSEVSFWVGLPRVIICRKFQVSLLCGIHTSYYFVTVVGSW